MKADEIKAMEDRWEIEADLDALKRAKEVLKDSKRAKAVEKLVQEQQAALDGLEKLDEGYLEAIGYRKR